MPKNLLIQDLAHLKELAQDNHLECFIALKNGVRSSKTILWNPTERLFEVWNLIDDTTQMLSETELLDRAYTNIGYALQNNALYYEQSDI